MRDLFSGFEPVDYDVVTEAVPDQVEQIFYDQKVCVVGKSFEVCLVNGIEVAGYRKDTYFGLSDKNCKIEPAETLEEDLARRDLTINAMAFCPYTGELVDPYNGIPDLKNKIIRFVGNPAHRIYEDPCRIVRACRFLSKLDGTFASETLDALRTYSYLVKDYVAPERLRAEILKALRTKKASIFFQALESIGALGYIFPSLAACHEDGGPYHAETIFEHCMLVGDGISTQCPLTKLAGYLHDIGKPSCRTEEGSFTGHEGVGSCLASTELFNLRFSTQEIERITALIEFHMRDVKAAKGKGIRKALSKFKERNLPYREWLRLKFADATGNLTKGSYSFAQKKDLVFKFEKELLVEAPAFSVKDLAVSGHDVMEALGVDPGPEVGKTLRLLYELVLDNPEMNRREDLISWLAHYKN